MNVSERKVKFKMDDDIKKNIHRVSDETTIEVPFALGRVKAGFPSPGPNDVADEIDLNKILIRHKETTFYVRVDGDSMMEAGILDGDLAIVDRDLEAQDGDFVVAIIEGELTLKQFKRDDEHACGWLIPWNKKFHSIRVDANDDFMIWGVVTYVVHALNRSFPIK